MSHINHTDRRRRAILRSLGGAALALPFLPGLARPARAAGPTGFAKNFLFISTPNGIDPPGFWPTGGERDFVLRPVLAPLEKHRDKLLIVGPQFPSPESRQPVTGTGLRFRKTPGIHRAWVATTGDAARAPRTPQTGDGLTVRTTHASVDQMIAKKLAARTQFPSLEFGVRPVGGDVPCIINFTEGGDPLPRMTDDVAAWKRVFGKPMGVSEELRVPRRASVSNFLRRRFSALTPTLGREDRQLLDGHLHALSAVEARLGGPGGDQCALVPKAAPPFKPAVPSDASNPTSDAPAMCANMQDMVALAFACNLTRVASISMSWEGGGSTGGLSPTWLGFANVHHAMSHNGGNPAKLEKYNKITNWYAQMIARMLDQLKLYAHPEGGTLYDHTLVWWMFRHGDGNKHADFGVPGIIAGGAGGYFGQMGRFLNLPATDHASFLFSMVNAMGIEIDAFGIGENRVTAPLGALRAPS